MSKMTKGDNLVDTAYYKMIIRDTLWTSCPINF